MRVSPGLRIALLCAAALLASGPLSADADADFAEARRLAFAGEREQARELCREILAASPGYHDVRVLLGRLHAWDDQHDEARRELTTVLDQKPGYIDARVALIDNELWADRPHAALEAADAGLALDPDEPALHARRARALAKLGRKDEALEPARRAATDPAATRRDRGPYYRLLDRTLKNKVAADYEVEIFTDMDNWHFLSVDYRRKTERSSYIGRINYADRFDRDGVQFEFDAYPKLPRRNYLYLNLGVSGSSLFPDLRYGAEIYHNFAHGWEASFGFRRLEFDSSDVTIWTGSLAKYKGNWWISLRPNFVDKADGNSESLGLTARRYFGGRYEYLEFGARFGDSKSNVVLIPGEDERFASSSVRVELRRRIRPRTVLKGKVVWRVEDLQTGSERESVALTIGFERHF